MNKTHLYFRSKAGVEVFDHRSGHQGGNEAGQGVDSRTCLPAIRLALSGHLCKADISSCPKNTNHSASSNDALSQLHQLFRAISPSPESTSEVCPPSRARPCGLAMVEIHPWCGPASQEQQMKGCESQTLCYIFPLGMQNQIVGHKNPPVRRICDTEVNPYLETVNFFAVHLLLMVLTHLMIVKFLCMLLTR